MRFELLSVVTLAGLAAALPHDKPKEEDCDDDKSKASSIGGNHAGPPGGVPNPVNLLQPPPPKVDKPQPTPEITGLTSSVTLTPLNNLPTGVHSSSTPPGSPPSPINPGHPALCPAGSTIPYLIQSGDTLLSIATRTFSGACQIAAINNIANVDVITAGDTILIPIGLTNPDNQSCLRTNDASTTCVQPADAGTKNVTNGQIIVSEGQTFTTIAQTLGITTDSLTSANSGVKPESLQVGQSINVPICGSSSGSSSSPVTTNPVSGGQPNSNTQSNSGTTPPPGSSTIPGPNNPPKVYDVKQNPGGFQSY